MRRKGEVKRRFVRACARTSVYIEDNDILSVLLRTHRYRYVHRPAVCRSLYPRLSSASLFDRRDRRRCVGRCSDRSSSVDDPVRLLLCVTFSTPISVSVKRPHAQLLRVHSSATTCVAVTRRARKRTIPSVQLNFPLPGR